MIVSFPDLQRKNPEVASRALTVGKLSKCRNYIEVPDDFDFGSEAKPEPLRGLGDVVALFAKPVARAIDGVLGTNLSNCGGCGERQDALNKAVPFK